MTARANRRTEGFTNAVQEIGYQGIRRGDLVIHSMDGFAGAVGVSDSDGKASPVVHTYLPADGVDARFFAYMLRTLAQTGFVTSLARGIRERSTAFDTETFASLTLPAPAFTNQSAIADYLDHETARIDALIVAKRRMRELLDERWGKVLDNVIWKGAAPRVPLRRVTTFVDYRGATPAKQDYGIPLVTASHIRDGAIKHSVDPQFIAASHYGDWMRRGFPEIGDVIMTTEAPLGEVAQIDDPSVALAQRVILLKASEGKVLPDFLGLVLRSMQFKAQLLSNATGSTALGIKADRLKGLVVPTPSIEAQSRIVADLAVLDDGRSSMASILNRQTRLLQERRQALVTAAVTGQLDIPEFA